MDLTLVYSAQADSAYGQVPLRPIYHGQEELQKGQLVNLFFVFGGS